MMQAPKLYNFNDDGSNSWHVWIKVTLQHVILLNSINHFYVGFIVMLTILSQTIHIHFHNSLCIPLVHEARRGREHSWDLSTATIRATMLSPLTNNRCSLPYVIRLETTSINTSRNFYQSCFWVARRSLRKVTIVVGTDQDTTILSVQQKSGGDKSGSVDLSRLLSTLAPITCWSGAHPCRRPQTRCTCAVSMVSGFSL